MNRRFLQNLKILCSKIKFLCFEFLLSSDLGLLLYVVDEGYVNRKFEQVNPNHYIVIV